MPRRQPADCFGVDRVDEVLPAALRLLGSERIRAPARRVNARAYIDPETQPSVGTVLALVSVGTGVLERVGLVC